MCIPFSLSHKKKISLCSNFKNANSYRYLNECDFGKVNYGILSVTYLLIFIIIIIILIFIVLYFYINVRIILIYILIIKFLNIYIVNKKRKSAF